jgi:5-deoxy-glucuronate isomerase
VGKEEDIKEVYEMLVKRGEVKEGYNEIIPEGKMKYIEFGILKLSKGKTFDYQEIRKESALVLLSGQVSFEIDAKTYNTGIRSDPFTKDPWALYLPRGRKVKIGAIAESEIAIVKSPSEKEGEEVFIKPEDVKKRSGGIWNWRRDIRDIIDCSIPSEKLLIGETINPPGNWSSWPPHKHDENDYPHEVKMEEVYHFRLNPPGGFALQRIYADNFNEVHLIEDGDTALIPRGYHPVVTCPGHQLYYLWILGGERRKPLMRTDPNFKWQSSLNAVLKEMI